MLVSVTGAGRRRGGDNWRRCGSRWWSDDHGRGLRCGGRRARATGGGNGADVTGAGAGESGTGAATAARLVGGGARSRRLRDRNPVGDGKAAGDQHETEGGCSDDSAHHGLPI